MSDDNRIGLHRVERDRRIDQRFALFDTRLRRVHIDDIRAHTFAGNFKRKQRSCAVFEKGIDDGQAIQLVCVLAGFPVEIDPLLGFLQQK